MMEEAPIDLSFFRGLPGAVWAIEHVDHLISGRYLPAFGRQLDEMLEEFFSGGGKIRRFDLINGITGIGWYALSGHPTALRLRVARQVITRLRDMAQPSANGGVFWRDDGDEAAPDHGMAHGQFGPATFLAHAVLKDFAADDARDLLGQSSTFFAQHFQPTEHGYLIPYNTNKSHRARAAWCYGGPGIARVLPSIARALDRPELNDIASGLDDDSIATLHSHGVIQDSCICHGDLGLALMLSLEPSTTLHTSTRKLEAGSKETSACICTLFQRALHG